MKLPLCLQPGMARRTAVSLSRRPWALRLPPPLELIDMFGPLVGTWLEDSTASFPEAGTGWPLFLSLQSAQSCTQEGLGALL